MTHRDAAVTDLERALVATFEAMPAPSEDLIARQIANALRIGPSPVPTRRPLLSGLLITTVVAGILVGANASGLLGAIGQMLPTAPPGTPTFHFYPPLQHTCSADKIDIDKQCFIPDIGLPTGDYRPAGWTQRCFDALDFDSCSEGVAEAIFWALANLGEPYDGPRFRPLPGAVLPLQVEFSPSWMPYARPIEYRSGTVRDHEWRSMSVDVTGIADGSGPAFVVIGGDFAGEDGKAYVIPDELARAILLTTFAPYSSPSPSPGASG